MQNILDIETLLTDRNSFNSFVYVTTEEAVSQLRIRKMNRSLEQIILNELGSDIPHELLTGMKAALVRHLATPNYEVRRFFNIVDAVGNLEPILIEFTEDKFTSHNEWKHSLGKMRFYLGIDAKENPRVDCINIIDFNKFSGKKISEITTLWGQNLKDFHHELFEKTFGAIQNPAFLDLSSWLKKNGNNARVFYKAYMMLFLQHAVLFENFLLEDESELKFIKEIFLPSFITVYNLTGYKPLIVALEPTNIEGDQFWICHPPTSREYVEEKFLKNNA